MLGTLRTASARAALGAWRFPHRVSEHEDERRSHRRAGRLWQDGPSRLGPSSDIIDDRGHFDGVASLQHDARVLRVLTRARYLGGLRGHLRGGSERVLVYGTGGAAWPSVDHQFTSSNGVNTFVPAKDDIRGETAWGYQAGGGVEVRLGAHWSVSGEYYCSRVERQGRRDRTVSGPGAADQRVHPCERRRYRLAPRGSFEFETITPVGLSYRF